MTYLATMTLFLQETGPGRGEAPEETGGALIVVGVVLLAVLVVAAGAFAITRVYRLRRERETTASPETSRLPSEEGRPWSSGD